ncbi:MAG: polyphosphate kinase 2 family protein [Polyangiaceae bacterium]|nr:polyphosphate kinase 2 family protein [Polyangiaceae bacterium]
MLAHRFVPGKSRLARLDPADTGPFSGRDDPRVKRRLERAIETMVELQQRLVGEARHRLLIVLQAMDTGGKDGVIRRVIGPLDSRGCRVESFKAPNDDERSRDYLWRVHQRVPKSGEIVVFNRSHYEDVLVARVLGLAPPAAWKRRFEHIAAFEQMLHDEGTTLVKIFLHISKDEQKERLEARLRDPAKRWKFDEADLEMRARWSDFQAAYEDVLQKTSRPDAPWFVVPADRKWFRDLAVAELIAGTMKRLDPRYPEPRLDLTRVRVR